MSDATQLPQNVTDNTSAVCGLADEMKRETASQHRLAERSGIIADILNQSVSFTHYVLYVRNLASVYRAIEAPVYVHTNFEHDISINHFLDKRLERTPHLERDLDNLVGRKVWQLLPILPATRKYVSHINDTKYTLPIAMVGHFYVRYLGDLNGGQVLQRLLKEKLDLDDQCTNFYRFTKIKNLPQYRSYYRNMINSINVDTNSTEKIVSTATQAFQFNIDLASQSNDHKYIDLSLHHSSSVVIQ